MFLQLWIGRHPYAPLVRRARKPRSPSSRPIACGLMDTSEAHAPPGPRDPVPPTWLQLAERVAGAGASVVQRYFRQPDLAVVRKADDTPVTAADREAEQAMRELIAREAPERMRRVLGEEGGGDDSDHATTDGDYLWVLDPIDGTKAFLGGKPTFTTLVALVRQREPVLGVLLQPITGECWTGAHGHATRMNGQAVQANRRRAQLRDAILCATTPHMFAGVDRERFFDGLVPRVWHTLYGCDAYGYALLASGWVDMVAEADLKPWDFLALAPIVQGAGGVITDWHGAPLRLHSDGRVLAAATVTLHEEALQALRHPRNP
ncbi:hypothetical protein CDCA_CDCA19G4684 [Cyanidium caldarium]|uniref:Histidinol-phosphatase n=1 Tax=Cyanidium caldarium TaxID=2771 RepID=A0AAV9J278_CYACA|nr:hypothetical protein CDCA_CDCA19G4684 [Cyanidium caldarium]